MIDDAATRNDRQAITYLRDPTHGGDATTLNEIAMASNVCIEICFHN